MNIDISILLLAGGVGLLIYIALRHIWYKEHPSRPIGNDVYERADPSPGLPFIHVNNEVYEIVGRMKLQTGFNLLLRNPRKGEEILHVEIPEQIAHFGDILNLVAPVGAVHFEWIDAEKAMMSPNNGNHKRNIGELLNQVLMLKKRLEFKEHEFNNLQAEFNDKVSENVRQILDNIPAPSVHVSAGGEQQK